MGQQIVGTSGHPRPHTPPGPPRGGCHLRSPPRSPPCSGSRRSGCSMTLTGVTPVGLTPDSPTLTHPPSCARSAAGRGGAGAGPGREGRSPDGGGAVTTGGGIWAILGWGAARSHPGSASANPPAHLRVSGILSSVCRRPTESLASLESLLLLLAPTVHFPSAARGSLECKSNHVTPQNTPSSSQHSWQSKSRGPPQGLQTASPPSLTTVKPKI